MGISSIWTAYAGYLHLYPRLVSYLASFFDLSLTPTIFFCFCFLAYAGLVYVIVGAASSLQKGRFELLLLALIIIFQPHRDEVFFNITNVQWWLGSALCIFALVYRHEDQKNKFAKSLVILIASLTGPFSIFLFPILVINLLIRKDWKSRRFVYIPVIIGASIQLALVLLLDRVSADVYEFAILDRLKTLLFFGRKTKILVFVSIVFWAIVLSQLVRIIRDFVVKKRCRTENMEAIFLLLIAGMVYSSLIFLGASAQTLSPLGGGGRYFFFIYSLMIFASWLLFLNNSKMRVVLLILMFITNCSNKPFSWGKHRINYQFQSQVEFYKHNEHFPMKINPGGDWKINAPNRKINKISEDKIFEISWDKKDFSANEGVIDLDSSGINYFANVPKNCSNSKHLGIEMKIYSKESGEVKFRWSKDGTFSKKHLLKESFLEGESTLYFAIPAFEDGRLFLKDDTSGGVKMLHTKIYCF